MAQTGDLFQPGDDHLQPDSGFLSSQKVFPLLDNGRRGSQAEKWFSPQQIWLFKECCITAAYLAA
jgi:hypothetical protein